MSRKKGKEKGKRKKTSQRKAKGHKDRDRDREKNRRKHRHKTELHRLSNEEKQVKQEIRSVNKDYGKLLDAYPEKTKSKRQRKQSKTKIIIISLLILIYISLILTSIGTYDIYKTNTAAGTDNLDVKEHSEKIEVLKNADSLREEKEKEKEKTGQEETEREYEKIKERLEKIEDEDLEQSKNYRGVVLESITTESDQYHPGEPAVTKAAIRISDQEELELEVDYRLLDDKENKVYAYRDKAQVTQEKGVLKKSILLTENYEPGKYTIEFLALFEIENTKYALPGKTRFEIVERPKESHLARAGRIFGSLGTLNYVLLTIAIILNLILLYNAIRIERDEKEKQEEGKE